MTWGAVAGAVVGVVGASMSADAAGDAADSQIEASKEATALQRYIYEDQKKTMQPWLQAGTGGLNKLSYMMGLSPVGYGGTAGGNGLPTMETPEQIRARLVQRFTTQNTTYAPGGYLSAEEGGGTTPGAPITNSVVNEAGLVKAIAAEQARQQAAYDRAMGKAEKIAGRDPEYGSLLDKFGLDDFQADPGYAFRQQEGEQALQRQLAAGGKLYSGEAMKDMARFSQGLASQEYGAAFDRFNVGQTNQFNRLASISGIGQTAANQTGAAGQNYANQAGANIIGAGNAAAAGRVGAANAWTGALGQGVSAYQQNQLFNSMQPRTTYGGYGISGGGGFGTGSGYGNQDYGQYL